MFECMEIVEYFYDDVVEHFFKCILENILTVLVTEGKLEDNKPRQKLTLRLLKALENVRKCM